MKQLQIAKDLSLPVDVVTQTVAVLAKRRAGKSYTMRRLVEQLHRAGQQVVLVDPKGDQWGVLSSADGKTAGLPFIILGGERGHVKLEVGAGEIVAKLVVEERVSIVLDLSLFRKHEVATFMTAFLENLYRLKAREIYRTPVMLVMDEADAIAPQKPQKGEERMLGAAEDIVRRGGQRGIGCVLVTQRSAVLNKNVLTQAQILIALRTIAPQDLDAMKAWIDVHGTIEQQRTLMASLPSLPVGDAWVWSPGWPTIDGIFKRVHVLPIDTFDSGKTPEPGAKPIEPKTVADIDVEALKRQMRETLERAKADDPKELKKQLAEANRMLARQAETIGRRPSLAKEGSALTDADRALIEKLSERLNLCFNVAVDGLSAASRNLQDFVTEACNRYIDQTTEIVEDAQRTVTTEFDKASVKKLLEKLNGLSAAPPAERQVYRPPTVNNGKPLSDRLKEAAARIRGPKPQGPSSNGDITGPELKILTSLAELEALGLHPADKQQLGLMAGYTNVRSGGFSEPLGRLIANGYATSPQTGKVAITDAGRAAVGQIEPPATPQEMQDRILAKLTGPEHKLLRVIIARYPGRITKEALGAECGYTNIRSGGFSEPLGRLNTLGIIQTPVRGEVVASPALFLERR